MDIKLKRKEDLYVIELHGEMDLYNASKVKEIFMKIIEKNIQKLLIDFQHCEYIDSTGVGTLLGMYAIAKEKKMKYFLIHVKGTVERVLTLTKLMEYFPILPTLESAIEQINRHNGQTS